MTALCASSLTTLGSAAPLPLCKQLSAGNQGNGGDHSLVVPGQRIRTSREDRATERALSRSTYRVAAGEARRGGEDDCFAFIITKAISRGCRRDHKLT